MKALLLAVITLGLITHRVHANPEITIGLPNGAKMDFVRIEPGVFVMGSPDSEPTPGGRTDPYDGPQDEHPQHQVTISRGFWLGKYEVTQRQWEAIMGSLPWSDKPNVLPGTVAVGPDYPAIELTWTDTQLFIHQLNTTVGDSLFRLPTEAEWEYACRAGTVTRWSFGDDESKLGEYAISVEIGGSDDSYALKPMVWMNEIGTKIPNPWGLYDMHGNAMEWVQDWFGVYPDSAQVDPVQTQRPEGPAFTPWYRMMRGGARGLYVSWTRSAFRFAWPLWNHSSFTGVRLVCIAPELVRTFESEPEDEEEAGDGDGEEEVFIPPPAAYLSQNYPNPFNGETQIRFQVANSALTYVGVFDLLGKKVATLVDDFLGPGYHGVTWDGRDFEGKTVGSGMYVIRLDTGQYRQTRKALLVR